MDVFGQGWGVVAMAGDDRSGTSVMGADPMYNPSLQDDHRSHRRNDILAWSALLLGVATVLLAVAEKWDLESSLHWVGVVTGAVGFLVATYAQMVSATTRERWIIVPGWVLSGTFGAMNFFFAVS
jgi:hypothetical protein